MPIYRNQETGHEVEVMPGTRLPKASSDRQEASRQVCNRK